MFYNYVLLFYERSKTRPYLFIVLGVCLVHPEENNFIHIKCQREGCPHNLYRDEIFIYPREQQN